jgi:predicted DCC family thiol-disulfide oxidoreductase YuxK
VHTEITETIRGYVFYDATCPICRKWVGRIHGPLARRGFHSVPLQAPWARKRLGLAEGEPPVEMKLLTRDGKICGGADALVRVAREIWWLWPFFVLGHIPGAKMSLQWIYVRVAANRPCDDGVCQISRTPVQKHRHKTGSFFELP